MYYLELDNYKELLNSIDINDKDKNIYLIDECKKINIIKCEKCLYSFSRTGRKPYGCYSKGANGVTLHNSNDFCSDALEARICPVCGTKEEHTYRARKGICGNCNYIYDKDDD